MFDICPWTYRFTMNWIFWERFNYQSHTQLKLLILKVVWFGKINNIWVSVPCVRVRGGWRGKAERRKCRRWARDCPPPKTGFLCRDLWGGFTTSQENLTDFFWVFDRIRKWPVTLFLVWMTSWYFFPHRNKKTMTNAGNKVFHCIVCNCKISHIKRLMTHQESNRLLLRFYHMAEKNTVMHYEFNYRPGKMATPTEGQ